MALHQSTVLKMTAFGSKSTIPPVSVVVIVFMAVITAALLHPAAATTQDDSKKSLTSALILGEESLVSIVRLYTVYTALLNSMQGN